LIVVLLLFVDGTNLCGSLPLDTSSQQSIQPLILIFTPYISEVDDILVGKFEAGELLTLAEDQMQPTFKSIFVSIIDKSQFSQLSGSHRYLLIQKRYQRQWH
jgi:hypothetical protein